MFSSCGNRTINVIYDILPSFNNVMFTSAIYYNRTIRIVDSFLSSESAESKFSEFGAVSFPCPYRAWLSQNHRRSCLLPHLSRFRFSTANVAHYESKPFSSASMDVPRQSTLLHEKPYFFNHLSFVLWLSLHTPSSVLVEIYGQYICSEKLPSLMFSLGSASPEPPRLKQVRAKVYTRSYFFFSPFSLRNCSTVFQFFLSE